MARVAILVDGDNISPGHAEQIFARGRAEGRVETARIYADATRATGWAAVPGYRLIHAGSGKNAADLLLSIEAMDRALAEGYETFVIASSDGDFTHLALRLRELGKRVIGLGEDKAPALFRAACAGFVTLSAAPRTAPKSLPTAVPTANGAPADPARPTALDMAIRSLIAAHSKHGRGMRVTDLNSKMRAQHQIKISTFPERTWRAYLDARRTLYDLDPRGPDAHVRFRPEGF